MLTRDQVKANIDALQKQGANRQQIQGWLDSLKTPSSPAKFDPPPLQQPGGDSPLGKFSDQVMSGVKGAAGVAKDFMEGGLPKAVTGYATTPQGAKQGVDFATGMVRQTLKSAVQLPMAAVGGVASLTGNDQLEKSMKSPLNVPGLGEVHSLSATPGDTEKFGSQTPMQTLGQAGTMYLEGGAPGLGKLLKTPLTNMAEKLYQSALKPTEAALESGVVQTGLKERVWLTQGGVERAAQTIDNLESQIGKAIDEGKAAGKKVSLQGMKEFIDPIRKWFETVDIAGSQKAQEYIDTTIANFEGKYGKEIPIEEAQKLKVNTMRQLRSAYGELTSVEKETQKQMARFLKEGVVKESPIMGEINQRLKNLYALDESLGKASRRIGNLNLLGLGGKLGAAAGGKPGAVIGLIADFMDKAAIKSGAAIGLNELSNLAGGAGSIARIPITELLNFIHKNYGMDKSSSDTMRTNTPPQTGG